MRALRRCGLTGFLALAAFIIIFVVASLLNQGHAAASHLLATAPRYAIDATTTYQNFSAASKHLVIASYTKQNVTWLKRVPSEWEVRRYFMDTRYPPPGGLTVPKNQGREAMAYLTYIITNYHQLPDFMIFTHGHEKSWHQIEPLPAKIRALNLTALERENFISLRCGDQMGCEKQPYIDTKYPNWEGEHHMCDFWKTIIPHEPCPRYISYKCCAQHAVTRRAILRRSRNDWIRIREPLMSDITKIKGWGEGSSDWLAGMFYEKFWHVLLGTGPEYCPSIEHCEQVHFSNAIICDQSTDITLFEGDAWKDTNCVSAFDNLDRNEDPVVALRAWNREFVGRYAEMRGQGGRRREEQQKAYAQKKQALLELERKMKILELQQEAASGRKAFKGKGDFTDETLSSGSGASAPDKPQSGQTHNTSAHKNSNTDASTHTPPFEDEEDDAPEEDNSVITSDGERIDQGPKGGSAEKWRHEAEYAKVDAAADGSPPSPFMSLVP